MAKRKRQDPILCLVSKRINASSLQRKRQLEEEEAQAIIDQQDRFQISLMLKPADQCYSNRPLPYEILVKIFQDLISATDNPLRELFNLSRVCEDWRQLILSTPTLWSRIDLTHLPLTNGNLNVLKKIINSNLNILKQIRELSISSQLISFSKSNTTLNELVSAPNIRIFKFRHLRHQSEFKNVLHCMQDSLKSSKIIEHLSIKDSSDWLSLHLKWLTEVLIENGNELRELDLSMSLKTISNHLLRAVSLDYCPKLKLLDLSTCDLLSTHDFDAVQLAKTAPFIEVLRLGNVSFKRINQPPGEYFLKNLRELSMPTGIRDQNRDDALLATLAFGTNQLTSLDIRGSSITPYSLLDLESKNLRELHMDDICPSRHQDYQKIVQKWAHSLRSLSLIKINCNKTMQRCMETLCKSQMELQNVQLDQMDLSGSDVDGNDLSLVLRDVRSIMRVDLTGCRSLPRGCKGIFATLPSNDNLVRTLKELRTKLAESR